MRLPSGGGHRERPVEDLGANGVVDGVAHRVHLVDEVIAVPQQVVVQVSVLAELHDHQELA